MKSLKIAKPAEQVNGQDERAAPAVDSSDCPCWWVIITTGLAVGLLTPYKGLLPALESKDSSNGSPAATSFTY